MSHAYALHHDEPEPDADGGASVSYQLAHETSRELELCGEYVRAAELYAVALADEAQRINQQALGALDLQVHPEAFRSITVAMAEQQQLVLGLSAPRLDERPRPLLGPCMAALAKRRPALRAPPRPKRVLAALARRWHLPARRVSEAWRDFVRDSGGTYTLSPARAHATLLRGQPAEVAAATWRLVAPMATHRCGLGAAALGGLLCACSGMLALGGLDHGPSQAVWRALGRAARS